MSRPRTLRSPRQPLRSAPNCPRWPPRPPRAHRTPTPIATVVTTIDRLLRNIVTAAMDFTGPGAPLDNPLAWTILAWTRRTFFNEPNTAATLAAANATAAAVTPTSRVRDQFSGIVQFVSIDSPETSGAVTVRIVADDPLGRPLTYSVLQAPKPATGTVTTESTPGVFTYTPTTAARVSAATGGPNTDTFIIKITPTANPTEVLATVEITAPVATRNVHLGGHHTETTETDTVVSKGTVKLTTDLAGTSGGLPRDHQAQIRRRRHQPRHRRMDLHPQHRGRRRGKLSEFGGVYFVDTFEELDLRPAPKMPTPTAAPSI